MKKICIILLSIFSSASFAIGMPKMPPTPVTTTTVQSIKLDPSLSAVGTLHAHQGIVIKPEVPGRITRIYFKSGQFVKKDQPLIELNADILRAELKAVNASLHLAKIEFDRGEKLLRSKSTSRAEFDKIHSKYLAEQAALARVTALLEQRLIKAPFTGVLGLRKVSEGDYVTPGQALVNLQALNPIYADFTIPERYVDQVKVGQRVRVTPDTMTKISRAGRVLALEPLVDSQTRSMTIRALVPNPKRDLLPGAFADVDLFFKRQRQVVSLPKTAVSYDKQGAFVYVKHGNKAVQRRILLDGNVADKSIIKAGLNLGEEVITTGLTKIHNGSSIVVNNG